jgi:hypothetical protein
MSKESNITVLPLSHRGNFYWNFFFQGRSRVCVYGGLFINTLLLFKNVISITN